MEIHREVIDVGAHAPSGATACYIIGTENALIVDPAGITTGIQNRFADITHIAVTHHHGDHIGGIKELVAETSATVWCRYGKESEFTQATGIEPDKTFSEGTEIPVESRAAIVRETPGHAPEHVAFEYDRLWLTGDLAVEEGSVVVGSPHGDMRAYITSLRRVWAQNPKKLLAAHGPIIEKPRETCIRLINHRLRRETRVLDAVRIGHETVPEILDIAYDKDLTGVEELAKSTIRSHLEKLSHEGHITWDGENAIPH